MDRRSWMRQFEYPLRVSLLGVAVLASVALPYWIIQGSANSTLEASNWVVHSADVKEKIQELKVARSELESVVLSRLLDLPQHPRRKSYQETRAAILPLLSELSESTMDNPEQQNRVGVLKATIDGRLKLFDSAIANIEVKNFDAANSDLKQVALLFGSQDASNEIIAAENALFLNRNEKLAAAQSQARWAVAVALLAQLALLGSVIFVSERQTLHRRRAESLTRLAIERSRIIVQTLREPIVVLDPKLEVLMINQAFGEFYGRSVEDRNVVTLDELGDGAWKEPELQQRLLDVAARGREIWDFELSQRSSDGIERIVLVNARRMENADDAQSVDKASILMTVSDVTARKRYEKRIQELNDDLGTKVEQISEVNRELESFSYSVSHDLRAPLRHIAGFADKLGAHIGDASDDKSRHYLGVIGDAARRMSRLIEDLLEYSRLGRNSFRVEPVNMNAVVAEVCAMLQSNLEARAIDWQIDELPIVMGDESMLRLVWQNLISNAIKYTAKRERAVIDIGLSESSANETVFHVRDNGTGFDMAYAGKLFGVFQRLHKPSEFPGTGIGLANVRRIINRHGGRAWAEAETDKGATVYFSLPTSVGTIKTSGKLA